MHTVKLRIVSNGSEFGTRVLDANTGEDFAEKLGIRNVRWISNNGEKPFLSLDLCSEVQVEIISEMPQFLPLD